MASKAILIGMMALAGALGATGCGQEWAGVYEGGDVSLSSGVTLVGTDTLLQLESSWLQDAGIPAHFFDLSTAAPCLAVATDTTVSVTGCALDPSGVLFGNPTGPGVVVDMVLEETAADPGSGQVLQVTYSEYAIYQFGSLLIDFGPDLEGFLLMDRLP